jgi:hypothetical protein
VDQDFVHPLEVQETEDVFESNEEKIPRVPIHKAHVGGHLDHVYRVLGISLFENLVLQIHNVVMHVLDAAPISLTISLGSIGSPR